MLRFGFTLRTASVLSVWRREALQRGWLMARRGDPDGSVATQGVLPEVLSLGQILGTLELEDSPQAVEANESEDHPLWVYRDQ